MKTSIKLALTLAFVNAAAQTTPELFVFIDKKVGYQGYCLKDGTVVVKPQFCSATMLDIDGYFIVTKAEHEYKNGQRNENHIPNSEKYALLNKKGEFVLGFENNYQFISLSNGIITVEKNNFYGIVNDKNETIIPIEFEDLLEIDPEKATISAIKEGFRYHFRLDGKLLRKIKL